MTSSEQPLSATVSGLLGDLPKHSYVQPKALLLDLVGASPKLTFSLLQHYLPIGPISLLVPGHQFGCSHGQQTGFSILCPLALQSHSTHTGTPVLASSTAALGESQ